MTMAVIHPARTCLSSGPAMVRRRVDAARRHCGMAASLVITRASGTAVPEGAARCRHHPSGSSILPDHRRRQVDADQEKKARVPGACRNSKRPRPLETACEPTGMRCASCKQLLRFDRWLRRFTFSSVAVSALFAAICQRLESPPIRRQRRRPSYLIRPATLVT